MIAWIRGLVCAIVVRMRQIPSSGFRMKQDSNQSPQLKRQAIKLKFACSIFRYNTLQNANNKGAD